MSEAISNAINSANIGKLIEKKLEEKYNTIADQVQAEVNAGNSKTLSVIKDLSNDINKTKTQLSKTSLKGHEILFSAGEAKSFFNAKKVLKILNTRGIE